jgi:ribosomal protein S27AE
MGKEMEGLVSFTNAELEQYVENKLSNLRCHGCGESEFTAPIYQSDQSTLPAMPYFYKHPMHGVSFIQELVPLVCVNCGVVTFIFAHSIQRWLETEEPKDD